MIAIVTEPIDIELVLSSVKTDAAGGIDLFVGTTRNHSHGKEVLSLEYESFEPMAVEQMKKIAEKIRERWPIEKISMVHRVGKVEIGEVSVVIAVSAAHRRETFEACRYAIDSLKKEVPIWKKELFRDGEVWVDER